ncbi:MAG: hypothetical protein ACLU99_00030 [Alphaproteobacteria bacterium]
MHSAAALYGNDYYKERARDELKFLTFKLRELRRLRTKMQATPDKTDAQERTERELINRGQAYLLYKTGVLADEFENDPAHQFLRIRPQTSMLRNLRPESIICGPETRPEPVNSLRDTGWAKPGRYRKGRTCRV